MGRPTKGDEVKKGDNCHTKNERGNDQTYLARKILTQAPETFARLEAGEFRSVRAILALDQQPTQFKLLAGAKIKDVSQQSFGECHTCDICCHIAILISSHNSLRSCDNLPSIRIN